MRRLSVILFLSFIFMQVPSVLPGPKKGTSQQNKKKRKEKKTRTLKAQEAARLAQEKDQSTSTTPPPAINEAEEAKKRLEAEEAQRLKAAQLEEQKKLEEQQKEREEQIKKDAEFAAELKKEEDAKAAELQKKKDEEAEFRRLHPNDLMSLLGNRKITIPVKSSKGPSSKPSPTVQKYAEEKVFKVDEEAAFRKAQDESRRIHLEKERQRKLAPLPFQAPVATATPVLPAGMPKYRTRPGFLGDPAVEPEPEEKPEQMRVLGAQEEKTKNQRASFTPTQPSPTPQQQSTSSPQAGQIDKRILALPIATMAVVIALLNKELLKETAEWVWYQQLGFHKKLPIPHGLQEEVKNLQRVEKYRGIGIYNQDEYLEERRKVLNKYSLKDRLKILEELKKQSESIAQPSISSGG